PQNLQLSVLVVFISMGLFTISVIHAEIVDGIAAVVNSDVITMSMLEDNINSFWTDTYNRPKSKAESLEKLIDHILMLQEARRLGISVSEENLALEVAKLVALFPSQKEFDEALKRRGITQKDLEENLIEQIMIRGMINRKFQIFVEVSDLDASEYYENHKDELIIQESIHLKQIFFHLDPTSDEEINVSIKKQAEDLFEDIQSGGDFSKYVGDSEQKYISVDFGYVDINEINIPVVASTASQLKIGESKFIETPAGYFIIKLYDRRPARQPSFDEVKGEIKARITQQKTEAELKDWLLKQRETADIIILFSSK
ncbi:hypothetical protein FJZ33_06605, partial [Candidatus Poribacteria bacterium]|nr:hypothetical protein [Candidatus Poribacteria bacterium]